MKKKTYKTAKKQMTWFRSQKHLLRENNREKQETRTYRKFEKTTFCFRPFWQNNMLKTKLFMRRAKRVEQTPHYKLHKQPKCCQLSRDMIFNSDQKQIHNTILAAI
ncbi:hypothetical protein HYD96_00260 [Mycoplasmopsis bovis]|nr:hypothetical protein [Mycoplasmopsis bovis]QQH34577.1 hypothetical protein HYD96_00260 [Mycoplasmopsis bovis]